ncbi:GTP cyclohydrolase I FolE, partial [bacterium]|nr:GTP cyclohydrolase I FolE [bacterium]
MSYNKSKCDPELGKKIHEHLVKCGVETPMAAKSPGDPVLDRKDKIERIEKYFTLIMDTLGLDLS